MDLALNCLHVCYMYYYRHAFICDVEPRISEYVYEFEIMFLCDLHAFNERWALKENDFQKNEVWKEKCGFAKEFVKVWVE
jgi:hypothetical protein